MRCASEFVCLFDRLIMDAHSILIFSFCHMAETISSYGEIHSVVDINMFYAEKFSFYVSPQARHIHVM